VTEVVEVVDVVELVAVEEIEDVVAEVVVCVAELVVEVLEDEPLEDEVPVEVVLPLTAEVVVVSTWFRGEVRARPVYADAIMIRRIATIVTIRFLMTFRRILLCSSGSLLKQDAAAFHGSAWDNKRIGPRVHPPAHPTIEPT
jgi:hypothetical protein